MACAPSRASTMRPPEVNGVAREDSSKNSSANTALIRNAVSKFFPDLLTHPREGSLYLLLDGNGSVEDAAFGSIDEFERMKARNSGLDRSGGSLEIVKVGAGSILPRALTAVLVRR